MESPLDCAIFCRVLDNYGDAGVAWRLSSQLANEHGLAVTLYVDDIASLARIVPPLDATRPVNVHAGVTVRPIRDADGATPARIVVETFGCGLPARYVDAMEQARPRPVWINVEYLSAEPWVDGTHGLPSPPPQRALSRWFFFPGFTPRTGGLIRERHLFAARDAYARDVAAQSAMWRELGMRSMPRNALTVSLFAYPNAPAKALLQAFADDREPVVCVVPDGIAGDAIEALAGQPGAVSEVRRVGALTLVVAPFVDQQAFDARLWACALNFVRGEDSFVRAQWAGRPLVWQPYVQAEHAHVPKLEAFLARYCEGLPAGTAQTLQTFVGAWNAGDGDGVAANWRALRSSLPLLSQHAHHWARTLSELPDLATALVEFTRKRL